MKDSICITYPTYIRLESYPVRPFSLLHVTFTLVINKVDFIIRDLEAVAGGDAHIQSICVPPYRRCTPSKADADE